MINKLVRQKKHWEIRIKELGGPDYTKRSNDITEFGGVAVPGTKGNWGC
jgi:pre-mRNA-splicing factor ISY1